MLDAIITSPPYAATSPEQNGRCIDLEKMYRTYRQQGGGSSFEKFRIVQESRMQGYGATPGQIGALKSGALMETRNADSTVADCEWLDWHGCYDGNWNDLIVPEAFAHPAKMAHDLLLRIIAHGFERGYWKKGSVLGDPFGGIFTTGIVGASAGLRVIGCELEPHFFDLGQQNIALHRQVWERCGDPAPVMINGDSRRFAELVGQVCGVVTSPPYISGGHHNDIMGAWNANGGGHGVGKDGAGYGQSGGQVGQLPAGNLDAVLTSPPYAESVQGAHGETETAAESRAKRKTPGGSLGQSARHGGYGVTDGQVGALKDAGLDGVVTSPPFMSSTNRGAEDPTFAHKFNGPQRYSDESPRDPAKTVGGDRNSAAKKKERDERAAQIKNVGEIVASSGATGLLHTETYWAAMKQIWSQCHAAIKPGGTLVCVIKDYVSKKKRVPLCDQTCALLEHVGFKVVTRCRAWLVKETSGPDLFGGEWSEKVSRKSFFRRLAEKKGSPAIDFEEVLWCVRE